MGPDARDGHARSPRDAGAGVHRVLGRRLLGGVLHDDREHDGDGAAALRELGDRRQGPGHRADAVDDEREGGLLTPAPGGGAVQQILDDGGASVIVDLGRPEVPDVRVVLGRRGRDDALVPVVRQHLDGELSDRRGSAPDENTLVGPRRRVVCWLGPGGRELQVRRDGVECRD